MNKFSFILVIMLVFGLCSPACNAGYTSFHSESFDIEVRLPSGWAASELFCDPGFLSMIGIVSFNSWGEAGFWALATNETMPDGSVHWHYSPYVVASRIPAGGAYVALVNLGGPPYVGNTPPEYTLDDLSGLYEPHDWRQETSAYFKNFYMGGSTDLRLEIACSQNATDETVAQLNALLKSWRFVPVPAEKTR